MVDKHLLVPPTFANKHAGGQGAGNGGQFASREDVVTVTINYRLSTYGFLAVPGQLPGNYGLADQITALDWVIANIEKFGGDPRKITIAGQSAGAGSVRVMLGSPKAIGKFQGAVAMSNLGLDFALGLGSGYGTTYSSVRQSPEIDFLLHCPRGLFCLHEEVRPGGQLRLKACG